jgi:hypothetical protein
MDHLKVIAHIYVPFINPFIRKCNIAQETTLLVTLLEWKSFGSIKQDYSNNYGTKPLIENSQEHLQYTPPLSLLSKFYHYGH